MQIEQAIENVDGTDNLGIIDANIAVDTAKTDNPDIGIKRATDSNSNGKSKTRRLKIISFVINNITSHGYSMQLIIQMMKLIKNLLGLK